jgi:hypothetical protein
MVMQLPQRHHLELQVSPTRHQQDHSLQLVSATSSKPNPESPYTGYFLFYYYIFNKPFFTPKLI